MKDDKYIPQTHLQTFSKSSWQLCGYETLLKTTEGADAVLFSTMAMVLSMLEAIRYLITAWRPLRRLEDTLSDALRVADRLTVELIMWVLKMFKKYSRQNKSV